jgi:hypothetical protein
VVKPRNVQKAEYNTQVFARAGHGQRRTHQDIRPDTGVRVALCRPFIGTRMRVRIISKPPTTNDLDNESLLVGRVYNLSASHASALMIDGYAELYETLTDDEKRERTDEASRTAWTAADSDRRWLPTRSKRR